MPKQKLASAVQSLPSEYAGLEVVLAQPEDSLPMLRKAYLAAESADGKDKLAYAHVLGIMGDATGMDTLLAKAKRVLADAAAKTPTTEKDKMDDVARLLWALGGTGDKRAVPILCEFIEAGCCSSLARLRAAAVSLGKIGDPSAADALARLIKPDESRVANMEPGTGNQETGFRVPGSGFRVRESPLEIRTLIVACALYRCGDKDGLAKRTLEQFTRGTNGPMARLAQQVLNESRTANHESQIRNP